MKLIGLSVGHAFQEPPHQLWNLCKLLFFSCNVFPRRLNPELIVKESWTTGQMKEERGVTFIFWAQGAIFLPTEACIWISHPPISQTWPNKFHSWQAPTSARWTVDHWTLFSPRSPPTAPPRIHSLLLQPLEGLKSPTLLHTPVVYTRMRSYTGSNRHTAEYINRPPTKCIRTSIQILQFCLKEKLQDHPYIETVHICMISKSWANTMELRIWSWRCVGPRQPSTWNIMYHVPIYIYIYI